LRKIIREEGLSAILVEQNAQKILGVTDLAIIIERGSIVYRGGSAALTADRSLLETYMGVTDASRDSRRMQRKNDPAMIDDRRAQRNKISPN
jgi:hypothetical protein